VSLGFGPDGKRIRRTVTGQTKTVVKDKLRDLGREIESGVKTRTVYTVADCLDDWLTLTRADSYSERARATGSPFRARRGTGRVCSTCNRMT